MYILFRSIFYTIHPNQYHKMVSYVEPEKHSASILYSLRISVTKWRLIDTSCDEVG
ncbi:MAG: hypothetical protein HFJ09_12415 [Lachnospiraceae bacterium]|nr:hypothetical protein [Lachnospiraceae bacterium]